MGTNKQRLKSEKIKEKADNKQDGVKNNVIQGVTVGTRYKPIPKFINHCKNC